MSEHDRRNGLPGEAGDMNAEEHADVHMLRAVETLMHAERDSAREARIAAAVLAQAADRTRGVRGALPVIGGWRQRGAMLALMPSPFRSASALVGSLGLGVTACACLAVGFLLADRMILSDELDALERMALIEDTALDDMNGIYERNTTRVR